MGFQGVSKGGTTGLSRAPVWVLPTVLVFGTLAPVLGTLLLDRALSGLNQPSLPLHSTLEVAGSALGLVLAMLMLFAQHTAMSWQRLWIAFALIAMPVLDIFHSCVGPGTNFVWLHSLAVLARGLFFCLVWFPDRRLSREAAWATAGAVLLLSSLVGALSTAFSGGVPEMIGASGFTPTAQTINLLGGGLTVLAAVKLALKYRKARAQEDLLFLILCLLFGVSGVILYMSAIWEAGWWFWHVLRFAGYLSAFWLAFVSYRRAEVEVARANTELDGLFHTAVDGKRMVDADYNHLLVNETFVSMAGATRRELEGLKCYEAFPGPSCHTSECPLDTLTLGAVDYFQDSVKKTRCDGGELSCEVKALRLDNPDGSFRGIIESYLDITEQVEATAST